MEKKIKARTGNKIPKACIVFIGLMLTAFVVKADAPDPGGDVDAVPIDGGISLLVAAGIGYGAKKIKDKRSMNTTNVE